MTTLEKPGKGRGSKRAGPLVSAKGGVKKYSALAKGHIPTKVPKAPAGQAKLRVLAKSSARPLGGSGKQVGYTSIVTKKLPVKVIEVPGEFVTVFGRMGRLLGEKIESEFDVVKIVGQGLPSSALDRLIDEINVDVRLIGSETTVRRRIQEKQHFTVDESERLVRLARITSMAEELFGGTKAATSWLSTRADYVPGSEPISPLELAATDAGARVVESMMQKTAHGVF